MPDGVTTIGTGAFFTEGDSPAYTLQSITFPDTLTADRPVRGWTVRYYDREMPDPESLPGCTVSDDRRTASFRTPAQSCLTLIATLDDEIPVPSPSGGSSVPGLNREEHIVYLQGRPGNLAAPNAPITREEAATIFYRLLDETSRKQYETTAHPFPDVHTGP